MDSSDPKEIARQAYARLERLVMQNPANTPAMQAVMIRTLKHLAECIDDNPDYLADLTREIERHSPPK